MIEKFFVMWYENQIKMRNKETNQKIYFRAYGDALLL